MQHTTNRHTARRPYVQPNVFLPYWEVAQTNIRTNEDRLLWAYVNGDDALAGFLKADIERLRTNLIPHFN